MSYKSESALNLSLSLASLWAEYARGILRTIKSGQSLSAATRLQLEWWELNAQTNDPKEICEWLIRREAQELAKQRLSHR